MDVFNNVLAPILVAAITATVTWLIASIRNRRKIDAAPSLYVEELDKLIMRAYREGPTSAIVNARAIVATRNSLRSSLVAVSAVLNSEIDRLSSEIGESIQRLEIFDDRDRQTQPDPEEVFKTIQVLVRVWPSKRVQIEVEIRKLLAELGLPTSSPSSARSDDYRDPPAAGGYTFTAGA